MSTAAKSNIWVNLAPGNSPSIDCRSGLQTESSAEHVFNLVDAGRKVASPLIPPLNPQVGNVILYLDSPSLVDVREGMERLAQVLGAGVGDELRIARGFRGRFALVVEHAESKADIEKILVEQNATLRLAGFPPARLAPIATVERLYNLSFFEDSSFLKVKERFAALAHLLSPDMMEGLRIERIEQGKFAIVSETLLRVSDAAREGRNINRMLNGFGFTVSLIDEKNNEPLYDYSNIRRLNAGSDVGSIMPEGTGRRAALAALREDVLAMVESSKRDGLIDKSVRYAFVVYDLTAEERLLGINPDVPMQTASMMKPFVAQAFYTQLDHGKVQTSRAAEDSLKVMIRKSRNPATNWLMRKMGGSRGPEVTQEVLENSYPSIFSETRITEFIPADNKKDNFGETYNNISSAGNYSRFLYALHHDQLPHSTDILAHMAKTKFSRILDRADLPGSVTVANKTGTTDRLCGDMGILTARGRDGHDYPYIVVGIIQWDEGAPDWLDFAARAGKVIGQVSNLAYQEMKRRYDLE